jgi:hypothetical protein
MGFPAPWSLAACFVVRDHNRQALAYIYFETEAEIGGETADAGQGKGFGALALAAWRYSSHSPNAGQF